MAVPSELQSITTATFSSAFVSQLKLGPCLWSCPTMTLVKSIIFAVSTVSQLVSQSVCLFVLW